MKEHLFKKKEKPQKPKYNMWQNTTFMISLAWKEKEKMVLVLCMLSAVLAVLNNLVSLYVVPIILDTVERRAAMTELIGTIIFFVAALMICSGLLSYISTNAPYGRISVRQALVTRLNVKASTTSYPNVEDDQFAKLLAKAGGLVDDSGEATQEIWTALTELLKNIMGFIIYVILLSYVNPWLIVLIVVSTLVGYYANKYANDYRYYHREELAQLKRRLYYIANLTRDYSAAKDLRIFNLRPWFDGLSKVALDKHGQFYFKAQTIESGAKVVDMVLAVVRSAVAYGFLISQVLSGQLTVAEFLLYFSAVSGFTAWVSGILRELSNIHKYSLDISTVRECLEYPEPFVLDGGEALMPENEREYELRLENVSFRYPGAEADTLSHINLTLHPGENLAVVGLNGAGKTTLVKLMCGFLDPTSGRVLLNGKDIKTYNRRDYYLMFSAVFQNLSILAGTIAANVAQTEENIDMDKVRKCVEKAGLKEKIESLPAGYETLLNREVYDEAMLLSGGETQRLMLARALYKDAPIIVLDEPTAALDPIAEADMYGKYHSMTEGKASVYISHRLASTRFCDRIILLDNAGIAEEGTHEELVEKGGKYAELFAIQRRYYQEGGMEDAGTE